MSAWICSPLHIKALAKALAIFATNKYRQHVFGRAHEERTDGEWDLSKYETD